MHASFRQSNENTILIQQNNENTNENTIATCKAVHFAAQVVIVNFSAVESIGQLDVILS